MIYYSAVEQQYALDPAPYLIALPEVCQALNAVSGAPLAWMDRTI